MPFVGIDRPDKHLLLLRPESALLVFVEFMLIRTPSSCLAACLSLPERASNQITARSKERERERKKKRNILQLIVSCSCSLSLSVSCEKDPFHFFLKRLFVFAEVKRRYVRS